MVDKLHINILNMWIMLKTCFSFENQNVDKVNNRKLMDDVYNIRSEIIKLKRVLIPMEQL